MEGEVLFSDNSQLNRARDLESSRSFPKRVECDHQIDTLVFGNRMCGTLEIVSSQTNQHTVVEISETASREIEIKEGRGTIIFSRRTSPYSLFRADSAGDRHEALIRVLAPPDTLRRVCSRTRLATVTINDYAATEFTVNASLGGAIFIKNVRSETLRYEAQSGACTIHAEAIETRNLVGNAYLSAHVLLSGKAENHRLVVTHRAVVDARQIDTQHAIVTSSHSSRVHFGRVHSLKALARQRARLFLNQIDTIDADGVTQGHFVY